MNLESLGLSAPKMIMGAQGQYWEYARADNRSLYLKMNFEDIAWLINGNKATVDALRVNVLYFGPEFVLPEPFLHLDARPYVINGVKVGGNVIGKVWVPLGQFNKALPAMYAAAKQHAITPLEAALAPVLEASGVKPVITLETLFSIMSESLDKEPVVINDYTPLICGQMADHIETVKATAKKNLQSKQVAAQKPVGEPEQGESDLED